MVEEVGKADQTLAHTRGVEQLEGSELLEPVGFDPLDFTSAGRREAENNPVKLESRREYDARLSAK